MITARHHFLIYPFFRIYTFYKIRKHFREVVIRGSFNDRNLPVLFLINHFSWWDGFWTVYLNFRVFHRKPFFMMEERQLLKYPFFKLTGGYPVRKGSRSVFESLDYTIRLLSDRRNMVMLFPQGRLSSLYEKQLRFERGIEHLINASAGRIHIVFVANLIEYLSNVKPTVFIYYREHTGPLTGKAIIEEYYNRFFSECTDRNIKEAVS